MPDDQRCSNAADGNLLAETVALAQKRLRRTLALQLPLMRLSESMGNHDSNIVDAGSVD